MEKNGGRKSRATVSLTFKPYLNLGREKSALPLYRPMRALPPPEEVCKVQQKDTQLAISKNILNHKKLMKKCKYVFGEFSAVLILNNTNFKFYTNLLSSLPAMARVKYRG
jgi:hypothetical protein